VDYRRSRRPQENTGELAVYLKTLVESRVRVTVFLKTGERLQGRIRYYDRNCFSIGLVSGLNVFLRNSSVLYIAESSPESAD